MILNNLFLVFMYDSYGDLETLFIIFVVIIGLCVVIAAIQTNSREKEIDRLNEIVDGTPRENGEIVQSEMVRVVSNRLQVICNSYSFHYITFEFEKDKKRTEFMISGETYGLIAEGDIGQLSYQGDKYIEFEVTGEQYGVMVEGDKGQITSIEDKISFTRKIEEIKKSEVVDIYVKVVSKRTKNDGLVARYFVAFENIDNGEYTELEFPIEQYKLILEGDTGKLIYNDKDVSFEREIHTSKKIDLVKR